MFNIRFQENNQIEIRCPWCGNKLKNRYRARHGNSLITIKSDEKCDYCGNISERERSIFLWSSSFSFLICIFSTLYLISLLYDDNKRLGMILLFGLISFYSMKAEIYFAKLCPFTRISAGAWYKRVYPYPYPKAAVAHIKWESYQSTKIAFLKWKIVKKTILPICFFNESGIPMSQTYCIAVEEIKERKENHSTLVFHFLLEEAPESLLKEGNRFYIFNEKSKIGEGIIRKKNC